MTSPAIGCLGEVMLELVPTEGNAALLGVAGDTYNSAVYLARAFPDAQVDYITVLGEDGFSDRILSEMARRGIGQGRVQRHPTRIPGLYAIETDADGERTFTYWRDTSAARCLCDGDMPDLSESLAGITHLLVSGISLAILPQGNRDRLFERLSDFRAAGGILVFDSNYRPTLWGDAALARSETERAWRMTDIGLPSLDDEMALFGDPSPEAALARLREYGLSNGALKRGPEGPLGLDGTEIAPPAPVAPVDTTAAGDSFNAAYLAEYLKSGDTARAMTAGHDLASRVIQHKGAIMD